jgi:hypothetical protein
MGNQVKAYHGYRSHLLRRREPSTVLPARSGSVSNLTTVAPEVTVMPGSVTKAAPFHTTTNPLSTAAGRGTTPARRTKKLIPPAFAALLVGQDRLVRHIASVYHRLA